MKGNDLYQNNLLTTVLNTWWQTTMNVYLANVEALIPIGLVCSINVKLYQEINAVLLQIQQKKLMNDHLIENNILHSRQL